MPRLFILDGMGLTYRAFYAFIRRPLVNSRGENTSAVYGFANSVLKILREERPDAWALAWDGPGPTERHRLYADYKAQRKPTPPELLSQLDAVEDVAQALGLPVVEMPGYEADDVMATLAVRGQRDGYDVVLVTSDKDMLQLVNERIRLLSPTGRGEEYQWVDDAAVREKWGVSPLQTRDVLALMGDTSDNIPGVPGVGEKTAVELIRTFGSLEALYDRLGEVTRDALRRKLEAHRESAMLSRELVTVRTDGELPVTWDDLRVGPVRRQALRAIARRYELVRLERVAQDLGVDDAEAGPLPLARAPERRGVLVGTPSPEGGREGEGPGIDAEDDAYDANAARGDDDSPRPDATEDAGDADDARTASAAVAGAPRVAADARPFATASPSPAPAAAWTASPLPAAERPVASSPGSGAVSAGRGAASSQAALDLWGGEAEGHAVSWDGLESRLHAVRARAVHGAAVLPITTGDEGRPRLLGLALAARDGTTAYAPLAHPSGPNLTPERARDVLGPLLDDAATPKIGIDLKRDRHALESAGLGLEGDAFDLHVASFLCDPEREHGLAGLARDVIGVALPRLGGDVAEARGRARVPIDALPVSTVAAWAEGAVALLEPIAEALRAQLEAREQWTLYTELEHPLIRVLGDMERAGVRIDRAVLDAQAERAGAEIARLEGELYALAGEELNLNSGPQLARVLFEKLGLKAGRRTKTGYSTDQSTLEELAGQHAFPARLLEYRVLSKLKSTYLDALPQVIDPRDGRIHTTFNQAGAATGRLSSSAPNLQNIPMRTALGREIRRAFVAPPGRVLVGADYSQIELRVMAHLSGDEPLAQAFARGEDVHAATARRIFNLSGDVPPELRNRAKIVNFGVMYGMGARSLSQQMGISLPEAKAFIGHYFRVYARVRDYLDATLEQARARGWVQTLFGRRRYLEGLTSTSGATRAFAERVAINMPIQGTAADVMKLAMTRVHHALKATVPSARLLLQVHDELLLECAVEDAEAAAQTMRVQMETCVSLRVPLEVSVGHGPSWLDVH